MKTKITSRTEQKFVKLIRTPRKKNKEIYDIKPYSLFKLVDALSNGDVLFYIDYCIIFGNIDIDISNTMVNISNYLISRMNTNSRKQVFGNVDLETLDDFKRYLKSIKSCKEVQIPTGNIVFSEDKYNAKQKSITDKKAELIKQFNDIANDVEMSVSERAKKLVPIRKEIDELNRIVLSKDEKEFQIEESITVKIKPIDALKRI